MPKVISKQTKTDRKLKLSNFRWAAVQPPISGEVCGLHFLHPGLRFRAALRGQAPGGHPKQRFPSLKKLLVMSCTNSAFSRVKVKESRSLFSQKAGKNILNFLLTLFFLLPKAKWTVGKVDQSSNQSREN